LSSKHLWHVDIHGLVVCYPGTDSICERDRSGLVGPHEARNTEHALRIESLRVQKSIVDASIDGVDTFEACNRFHVNAIVFPHDEVAPFDKRHTHFTGQKDVFEIRRIVCSRRQEDDLRILDALRGDVT